MVCHKTCLLQSPSPQTSKKKTPPSAHGAPPQTWPLRPPPSHHRPASYTSLGRARGCTRTGSKGVSASSAPQPDTAAPPPVPAPAPRKRKLEEAGFHTSECYKIRAVVADLRVRFVQVRTRYLFSLSKKRPNFSLRLVDVLLWRRQSWSL